MAKRLLTWFLRILVGVLCVFVLASWLVSLPAIQRYLVQYSARVLSEKLKTKVAVNNFEVGFFNRLHIGGVYIEDQQKDTLAYVGQLSVKTNELLTWSLSLTDKPQLKTLILNDVWVYMHRPADTSRWNFDFIAEAFSSPSTDTTTTDTVSAPVAKTPSASSGPLVDLKNISLKNIHFFMDDAWRGEDIHVELASLQLNPTQLDFTKKQFAISELALNQPHILYHNYDGGKPKDLRPDDTTSWGTPFNPDLYRITLQKLTLDEGSFTYENDTDIPAPGHFDEDHIVASHIQLNISDLQVKADTIFGKINQMKARDRSGLAIESMQANLKLSQVEAELSDLMLKTNRSVLGDYFAMRYKNFHAFNDFLDQVTLYTRLHSARVSSEDVGFFAPILNEYPITLTVSGNASGTIPHLYAPEIEIWGSASYFKGNAKVDGLPDIDSTQFLVNAFPLRTSGEDINRLVPQTRTDALGWNSLKNIVFTGSYTGRAIDFALNGLVQTNLGNIDLGMSMNLYPDEPEYKGSFKTQGLNIGPFLQQTDISQLYAEGSVQGKGFDLEALNTKLEAKVNAITYAGSTYKNMQINGLFSKRKFDGLFKARDPGFNLDFTGMFDVSGKEPICDFLAQVDNVNLQKLGVVSNDINLSCNARMQFVGNDIDHFNGTARIRALHLISPTSSYTAEDILLEASETDSTKNIRLQSSLADAALVGKYNMSELVNTIKMYLYHYLPDYIAKPAQATRADFTFNVAVKDIDTLVQMFNRSWHDVNNIVISGALNTDQQHLSLDANIPTLGYDNIHVNDFYLVSAGDFESFDLNVNSGSVTYNDDVIIPSFQINSRMADDTASLSLISQSINNLLGEASLNIKATAFNDQLFVNILPSNISIKNDRWELFSNHDLVFGNKIQIQDCRIQSGEQLITINSKSPEHEDIVVDFKQVSLEGSATYLGLDDIQFHGRLSGQLNLNNYVESPVIELACRSEKTIWINETELGSLQVNAQYDVNNQVVILHENSRIFLQNNEALVQGKLNLKDSIIQARIQVRDWPIDVVGEFLEDYIKGLKGAANGLIAIQGSLQNPNISGQVGLSKLGLKVLFLGTTYTIPDADFSFNDHVIRLSKTSVYDERGLNYSAQLSGQINHNNFSDMYLDFAVTSPNFMCLNTNQFSSDLFYGYVPSALNAKLYGYLDDITADIDARPLKGTKFYLPINSSGDASTYDYVSFAKLGNKANDENTGSPNYFKLNMNIDATPDAVAYIVLDQNTGEEIIAKGNGALKLNVDLGNSLNMFGTYEITEGKYLFNFRGLIPREFAIDEKSKITWNGDAFDAQMDVKAMYRLPKPLPLYPLVAAQAANLDDQDLSEAKRSYTTWISLFLKGSLATPDINFDIAQPDNRAVGTAAYTRLEQIKNNPQELITQSGILLLLGEFKASDNLASSVSGRNYMSSVSELVSGAVSSEVTNLVQRLTGLKTISVNLNYQSSALEAQNSVRNEFKMNVSTRLLNDRIVVDFGNSVDVSRNQTGRTTGSVMSGDFKAQFLISEDGRLRANAYRTNSMDVDGENFTKSGAGLSYRKVFNSFSDLFVNTRKKSKKSPKQDSSLQNAS